LKNSIAKNTLLLYIRMLLMTGVTLYTSRIILDQLGVSDYGIYNLVAGMVAMLGFLNASMATATQRYLSYDIGKGDFGQLKITFSTSLTIHFALALVGLIVAETIGLWYVNYKMVFPVERTFAVNVVYQFSVLVFLLGIIQVPYNSLILARERMNIYAYVSIAEAFLKLVIAYSLVSVQEDKLIVFSILTFIVALIVRLIYQFYCRRVFKESHYKFSFNREYFSELLSYSGWNLFGNIAAVLRSQGSNVVLNLFFGTLVNAAYGITLQVQGAINMFVSNFQMALNPQIVQMYAANNLKRSKELVMQGCKLSFLLMLFIVFPILYNTQFLLDIWLKHVPKYTVEFVQIALIAILIDSMSTPIATLLQATGQIKLYQISVGGLNLLVIPISYFYLLRGGAPISVQYIILTFSFISLFFRIFFAMRQLKFDLKVFIRTIIFPVLLVSIVAFGIYGGANYFFNVSTPISFLLTTVFCSLCLLCAIFVLALQDGEKKMIYNLISGRKK